MGFRSKVETLKYNRDYSFLFSEDAPIPEPPSGFSQPPKTAKLAVGGVKKVGESPMQKSTSKLLLRIPVIRRKEENQELMRNKQQPLLPKSAVLQNSTGVSKQEQVQVLSRKRTAASSLTPKSTQQRALIPPRFHSPVSKEPLSRKGEIQEPRKSTTDAWQKPVVPSRFHVSVSKQPLLRKEESQEPRKSTSAAGQKPVVSSRSHVSVSKQPLSRKGESQEPRKSTTVAGQKPIGSSRLHLSVSKQPLSRKWEAQEPKKATAASSVPPKSAVQRPLSKPPSNPKDTHSQPLAKSSIHAKKRLRSDEDEELNYAISEIRKLFGYDPKKYKDEIEDYGNMVANFREIQMEEERSARIAAKEDREELRKIEQEERRERLWKNAKKRKIENEARKAYEALGLLSDDDDDDDDD